MLPHNPGNYPQSIGSAQEQSLGTEVPTKPSTVSKIHRRGRSFEEVYLRVSGTSMPIPTGGSVDSIRTSCVNRHAKTYVLQLQGG